MVVYRASADAEFGAAILVQVAPVRYKSHIFKPSRRVAGCVLSNAGAREFTLS